MPQARRALRWPRQEGSNEPVRLDLGWLGALILVAALAGGAYYFILRSPNEEASQVRGYYATEEQVPAEVLARLRVRGCEPYPDPRGVATYRCAIEFGSGRFGVCFGFDHEGVERGPREFAAQPGCEALVYRRWLNTMMVEPPGPILGPRVQR